MRKQSTGELFWSLTTVFMILQVWWCHGCHLDQYKPTQFSGSYNPNVPVAALGMCSVAKGHRFRDRRREKTANLTTQRGQGRASIPRNCRERQNLRGNVFVSRSVGQVTAGSERERSIFTHEICSALSVPAALPAWPGPASQGPRLPRGEGTDLGVQRQPPGTRDSNHQGPGPPPLREDRD